MLPLFFPLQINNALNTSNNISSSFFILYPLVYGVIAIKKGLFSPLFFISLLSFYTFSFSSKTCNHGILTISSICYNFVMKKLFLFLTISSLLSNWCEAKHLHPEKYYQGLWCGKYNGIMEYELNDKTRIDCVTTNYAVEFDFASKWAECIGQALYYGVSAKKKPVCLLIVEKPEDFKYFYRVKKVTEFFKFDLWYIKAPEYVYKNNK